MEQNDINAGESRGASERGVVRRQEQAAFCAKAVADSQLTSESNKLV
jgi:hypothetical protein